MSLDRAREFCVCPISHNGRTIGVQVVEASLSLLADFFAAQFSDLQLEEMARLIYDNFYWLDVVEFKIAIDRVKIQHYERVFGKLSPGYILDVFQRVSAESMNARENQSYNAHDQFRKRNEMMRVDKNSSEKRIDDGVHQIKLEQFKKQIEENMKAPPDLPKGEGLDADKKNTDGKTESPA